MKILTYPWLIAGGICLNALTSIAGAADTLPTRHIGLEEAITEALENDAWQTGNEFRHHSHSALSIAAGELPDPVISITAANFPTDTFDINQEPMTRAELGIRQSFPRGRTRSLKRQKLSQQANLHIAEGQDRSALLRRKVADSWLDLYRAEKSIGIIESNRGLFDELAEITRIGYASGRAKVRQDDVIRARIELLRLDDRITLLQEQVDTGRADLSEWLLVEASAPSMRLSTVGQVPTIRLAQEGWHANPNRVPDSLLHDQFSDHPSIQSIDQKIEMAQTEAQLARQKYKPGWSINASYGYRDRDTLGRDQADFLSVGILFDVPLFTAKRQDQTVRSADALLAAIKTDKLLQQRSILASAKSAAGRLNRLNERQRLYEDQLLGQMEKQAGASLAAYTNDDGDFSDVVTARIALLNTSIEALNIAVDRMKAITELNYFLTQSDNGEQGAPSGEQQ